MTRTVVHNNATTNGEDASSSAAIEEQHETKETTPEMEHFKRMFTLVLRGHIECAMLNFPDGITGGEGTTAGFLEKTNKSLSKAPSIL